MKKVLVLVLMIFLNASMCFAGQFAPNEKGIYYIQDDGTFAISKWIEDDFNEEGKNSSYYFDENGLMLVNATTPDGYFVGADGKWDGHQKNIENNNIVNKVQSKNTQVESSKNDNAGSGRMVWKSATGSKYHTINNCGNMNPKMARQITEAEAIRQGLGKCSKCW